MNRPSIKLSPVSRVFAAQELAAGRDERLPFVPMRPFGVKAEIPATSVVRAKLASTTDGTPLLDLVSDDETANGSTVDIGAGAGVNTFDVVLAKDDTTTLEGRYYLELLIVAQDGTAEHLGRGELIFTASMGGEL